MTHESDSQSGRVFKLTCVGCGEVLECDEMIFDVPVECTACKHPVDLDMYPEMAQIRDERLAQRKAAKAEEKRRRKAQKAEAKEQRRKKMALPLPSPEWNNVRKHKLQEIARADERKRQELEEAVQAADANGQRELLEAARDGVRKRQEREAASRAEKAKSTGGKLSLIEALACTIVALLVVLVLLIGLVDLDSDWEYYFVLTSEPLPREDESDLYKNMNQRASRLGETGWEMFHVERYGGGRERTYGLWFKRKTR